MDIKKTTYSSVQSIKGQNLSKTKKSDKSFSVEENSNSHKSAPTNCSIIHSLDALFMNLEQQSKKQNKFIEYGEDLLQELDYLRLGIITGTIPRTALEKIEKLLQDNKSLAHEPSLQSILLEIETRAKVELAKLDKMIS